MTLNIVPFKKEHIEQIETRYHFPDAAKVAFTSDNSMVAYTGMMDNKIFALGGVYQLWQGVAEAFFVMSSHAYDKPLTAAKYSRAMLDYIQEENNYNRLQASVNCNDDEAVRFIGWLGFENEGLMRKFGLDGTDYYRYARVQ